MNKVSECMGEDACDLCEALEAGEATEQQVAAALRLAASMSDGDMLSVDVFQGGESDVVVMSSKVVRGRAEYIDHYSRRPIAVGARQVVLREVCEGEFLTTRHSELSIWMLSEGFDPTGLVSAEWVS